MYYQISYNYKYNIRHTHIYIYNIRDTHNSVCTHILIIYVCIYIYIYCWFDRIQCKPSARPFPSRALRTYTDTQVDCASWECPV